MTNFINVIITRRIKSQIKFQFIFSSQLIFTFQNIFLQFYFPHTSHIMQNFYSTPIKNTQTQSKANKSHNQTREGDWVCLNCNNLNFSFRKKCNRCKTQTRKQNQDLQSAYSYYYYNQQQGNPYLYDNSSLYPLQDQMYYASEMQSEEQTSQNSCQNCQKPLSFSRNNRDSQVIQFTAVSPLKQLKMDENQQIEEFNCKKHRTPSSRKKKTLRKNMDLLPSVSPLLKKLLAKQDTHGKSVISNKKDPFNVALFYDQVWDNNKQNMQRVPSVLLYGEIPLALTSSGKKSMKKSRMNKTKDSFNQNEQQEFPFQIQSPEKQLQDDDLIQIDQNDEQLAQIISRIII